MDSGLLPEAQPIRCLYPDSSTHHHHLLPSPGFGMPTATLEHLKVELIQPQHGSLVHGQQKALLVANHLLDGIQCVRAEQQGPAYSLAAELWGLPLDTAQPQKRLLGSQDQPESCTWLSQG